MNKASKLQSSKSDSPKTPSGISKSFLTPIRRVGLSRNYRKSGVSPFQSPLASKNEVKQEQVESRKRKESLEESPQSSEVKTDSTPVEVTLTPSRNVELPRRKKSKILLASISNVIDENETSELTSTDRLEDCNIQGQERETTSPCNIQTENVDATEISTPIRSKSKTNKNLIQSVSTKIATKSEKENLKSNTIAISEPIKNCQQEDIKEISPNKLTKECVVVIQKKLFKKELKEKAKLSEPKSNSPIHKPISQAVFDSDSDEIPLVCLSNKDTDTKPATSNNSNEDDEDFVSKPVSKLKKTQSKSLASTKHKTDKQKSLKPYVHKPQKQLNSQSSDDDDFFDNKRTILIRKTYEKVTKPQKAKSTGSITQKDIDDLKSRIQIKKTMLLARAVNDEDTKELRDLIKKWRKGCQDALMELMDLMKSKCQDKQNMDYSEILKSLKIPADIVGYDSDNDCFVTPDDESIILPVVKIN